MYTCAGYKYKFSQGDPGDSFVFQWGSKAYFWEFFLIWIFQGVGGYIPLNRHMVYYLNVEILNFTFEEFLINFEWGQIIRYKWIKVAQLVLHV